MTTIRVSALDTAQAMDEIISRLGSDAMIIDTIKRNGKIEMIATDDPTDHGSGSKDRRTDNRDKVLSYKAEAPRREDMIKSAAEAMAELQQHDDEPLPRFNEIFDQNMIGGGTARKTHEDAMPSTINGQRKPVSETAAVQAELAEIKSMLSGMMITQPEGLTQQLGRTIAVQLRQAGFSPQIIQQLQDEFSNKEDDVAREAFNEAIARRLVRTDTYDLLERRLICVVGSSGSGKTTLASKIAAYCKERAIIDRVMLGAVSDQSTGAGDEIKDFARLMNMKSDAFGINELSERIRETSNQMIVDVSAAPEKAVGAISDCCREIGAGKVAVVQALPGGSSATMIKHQCANYHGLDPMIALTKLDECEATPTELSALATQGTGIGLLTGTKSIVGGIAIATSQILAQYLRENA
jgi:flagellar biosynthesis protein FlhF